MGTDCLIRRQREPGAPSALSRCALILLGHCHDAGGGQDFTMASVHPLRSWPKQDLARTVGLNTYSLLGMIRSDWAHDKEWVTGTLHGCLGRACPGGRASCHSQYCLCIFTVLTFDPSLKCLLLEKSH